MALGASSGANSECGGAVRVAVCFCFLPAKLGVQERRSAHRRNRVLFVLD